MTIQDRIRYTLKRPIFYKYVNGKRLLYVATEWDIMIDYAYRDAIQGRKRASSSPSV